jgi:hypothetical protein
VRFSYQRRELYYRTEQGRELYYRTEQNRWPA